MPIGGSDYHRHEDHATLAAPTTWVEAEERSVDAVLAAMVDGRVAISADPASPVLLRHDGELVAVDADGTTLVDDHRRGAPRGRRNDHGRLHPLTAAGTVRAVLAPHMSQIRDV